MKEVRCPSLHVVHLISRRIQGDFLVSKDLITLETTKDTTRVSSVDPRSLWVPFCLGFAEFFLKKCLKW